MKISKPLGEKLPLEESKILNTKVIDGVEVNRSIVNTDSSLTRPLRKSFNEGVVIFVLMHQLIPIFQYEPTIKIAQEFTGIELSKEYTAETIEKPIKWDRAISIPSNQGFESVIIESEDLNSDSLALKEPFIKSQESHLKSRAKKTSKMLGVRQLFDLFHVKYGLFSIHSGMRMLKLLMNQKLIILALMKPPPSQLQINLC